MILKLINIIFKNIDMYNNVVIKVSNFNIEVVV